MGPPEADEAARAASRPEPDAGQPRRVLIVSADMGGGHNATAAALEEAIQRLWPRSETRRVDTLEVMGPGVGTLFRAIYVTNVEDTPWLYEFFYASLWRHRWFALASKRFTGSWCGRRLAAEIDLFDPDTILSTYPLGSAGLAWLRRHRGLAVPIAGWISDFAPHPFWVYPELDANFVMHEVAVPVARTAAPGALVRVSAPPVVRSFQPGDRAEARGRLGIAPAAFVVLVSCGAYAFGDVEATVRLLSEQIDGVQVVAACGRNETTLRRLQQLDLPRERLLPLGWTEEMARVVQAADLVLTNAGGATALEALACGVPVLMSSPIAAHGKANADLMAVSGLAVVCRGNDALAARVRTLAAHPSSLTDLERLARRHVGRHDLDAALSALSQEAAPTVEAAGRPWRMRAADAFFAHVERDGASQDLGAVLELDPLPTGQPVSVEAIRGAFQDRTPGLPPLRRALAAGRPGWWLRPSVDVEHHVHEHRVPADATESVVRQVIGDFWSRPMPAGQPAWEMLLVHGQRGGRSLFAVKMHHSQGDGVSALGLLDRLLDARDGDPLAERRTSGIGTPTDRAKPLQVAAGLWHLATRGRVPRHRLNAGALSGQRDLVCIPLPWAEVRLLAREHRARPHELVIALMADALDRALRPSALLSGSRPLRAMVPVAVRAPRLDRIFGNWTGTLAIDLPMGELPLADRIAAVQAEVRLRTRRGEPLAAAAVMRGVGLLPDPLHGLFARAVYNQRFFNTIVSYMPGARGPRWCAGAPVRAMYPVLPLAPRVPLTIGVIVADRTAGVGILLDRALGLEHEALMAAVGAAFAAAGGLTGGAAPGPGRVAR